MTTNNEWIKHYDSLKQDVMKMRREGKHFPSSTVEGVKENIRNLESKLSIMESSQLEYEMYDMPIDIYCYIVTLTALLFYMYGGELIYFFVSVLRVKSPDGSI
jgi:hypothetical protein